MEKIFDGASELPFLGGFIAMHEVEVTGIFAEVTKDNGGAFGGRPERGVLPRHLAIEAGLGDAPEAHLAPTGDGDGFDERHFRFGCGLELGGKRLEKL